MGSHFRGVTAAAIFSYACISTVSSAAPAPDADPLTTVSRPNVLILFADDMRASAIGAMGVEDIKTPNLDRLIAGGTVFPHAYVEGGQGGAVCVASRAMLLTGQHLHHLKNNGSDIPTTATMLGEMLSSAGYKTYGIGKWHNEPEDFNRCFANGDEIMLGGMTYSQWEIPLNHYQADGTYDGTCGPAKGHPEKSPLVCDHYYKGRHSSEIFADAAVKFISDEKSGDDPYFLYVAFTAPHDPRDAPQEFLDMYDLESIELPPNFMAQHPFDNGHTGRDEKLLPHPRDPQAVKKEIRDYYAIISHMDSQIGRILEALEQSGEAENTIIVFAGDNGLAVGQHGLLGKQSLYEHSINVPMVWKGPGVPKGEKAEAYTYLTEIYPTLCDLLKLEKPDTVEAESFAASLRDPDKPQHDDIYASFSHLHRAVNDGTHKMIEYNVKGNRHTQLFNLEQDPWETKNLAETPEMKETLQSLQKKLAEHERGSKEDKQFWSGY